MAIKTSEIFTVYSIYTLEIINIYLKQMDITCIKLKIGINFKKIRRRTSKFETSTYHSCVAFERIPNIIKCLPTKSFKKQLTLCLLHKCYYSLNEFYDDSDRGW